MSKPGLLIIFYLPIAILWAGCEREPSPPKSPAEELETFQLVEGLKIELVASEPMVQEPIAMRFDEDGRLWVVEMRGFMPDIDGTGEKRPNGRISVLMDRNADGRMDSSVVFADSLVLPRSVAVVKGGALIAENIPLWYYEDTDGDLQADRRTLVDSTYGGQGIVEHSPNGLWRGMDGWYYNVKSSHRYKEIDGEWVKDETEFRGQWGMSHDNVGRLYYNYNWSQLHADLVPPNYLNRNPHHIPTTGIDHGLTLDRRVYPIRSNPASNRGYVPGTLDDQGRLREFASACSPFVYRGRSLPDNFTGDAFVCDPVANIVKRNIVEQNGYLLSARNAYEGKEFLASTDERFRPVSLAAGPDGALYIADMYRGIIQHGMYMTDYLREVSIERNLDEYIHLGRIWRIVPEGFTGTDRVRLSTLTGSELVQYLDHQDGWYRDTAQRLLVERGDKSVYPELSDLALDQSKAYTSRIHALWTLYELEYDQTDVYFNALNDGNEHVKALAIRLLENYAENDEGIENKLADEMSAMVNESSSVVNLQIALSAGLIDGQRAILILARIMNRYYELPLFRDAILSSLTNNEMEFLKHIINLPDWQNENSSRAITIEMLSSAISRKADQEEIHELLSMVSVDPRNFGWRQQSIIDGMALYAMNPGAATFNLDQEPGIVQNSDYYDTAISEKITAISNMFMWPGKEIQNTDTETVADEVQVDPEQFALGRQQYLSICASCHGNDGRGLSRFAPPLRNSEWVLGSEKRLALILLHGMEGPVTVAGKRYDIPEIMPEMPSFITYDTEKLAAIMTYIRREWGHRAEPVSPGTVGRVRVSNQGRLSPWTEEELKEITEESDAED